VGAGGIKDLVRVERALVFGEYTINRNTLTGMTFH
jgi:hypothetical protein